MATNARGRAGAPAPAAGGGPSGRRRRAPYAAAAPLRAASIACHTRIGVAGMSMFSTPRCERASTTAFHTAGVAPMAPDSPMPLAPSGFRGDGVSVREVSNIGSSAAVGSA